MSSSGPGLNDGITLSTVLLVLAKGKIGEIARAQFVTPLSRLSSGP